MRQLTTAQKVALAVSMPVTALLLYFLMKKNDEEEEEAGRPRLVTSRQTVIEVRVPRSAVGAVIGHQGAMINEIREATGARLDFNDSGPKEGHRVLTIRGSPSGAQQAEMMVRKVIADQPPLHTETIYVPQKALGRIIGRGGETIRQLQRASKCRINIDRSDDTHPDDTKEVILKGTPAAIANAKDLLEEKVREEEAYRAKMDLVEANRPGRGRRKKDDEPTDSTPPDKPLARLDKAPDTGVGSDGEIQWPEHRDYLEVWVSAVEHPGHFWVQLLSSRATRLDGLVKEMTAFYSQPNSQASQVDDPHVGDIVAAPFDQDSSWYRAKVIGFEGDKVDLYYVDYGDNGLVNKDELRQIRADFLGLPHQALRCSLANVKPVGSDWVDEDIDLFEDISHCAKWQRLQAKIIAYKTTPNGTLPCIELIDTSGEKDINIAEYLVQAGKATWDKEEAALNVSDKDSKFSTFLGSGNAAALARWDDTDELSDTPWHGRSPFTKDDAQTRTSPVRQSSSGKGTVSYPDLPSSSPSDPAGMRQDRKQVFSDFTPKNSDSLPAEGPVFSGYLDSDNDISPVQSCARTPPRELKPCDDIALSVAISDDQTEKEVPVNTEDQISPENIKSQDSIDIGYCSADEHAKHLEALSAVSIPSRVSESEEFDVHVYDGLDDEENADRLIEEERQRSVEAAKRQKEEEEAIDLACVSMLAPVAALAMETVAALKEEGNKEITAEMDQPLQSEDADQVQQQISTEVSATPNLTPEAVVSEEAQSSDTFDSEQSSVIQTVNFEAVVIPPTPPKEKKKKSKKKNKQQVPPSDLSSPDEPPREATNLVLSVSESKTPEEFTSPPDTPEQPPNDEKFTIVQRKGKKGKKSRQSPGKQSEKQTEPVIDSPVPYTTRGVTSSEQPVNNVIKKETSEPEEFLPPLESLDELKPEMVDDDLEEGTEVPVKPAEEAAVPVPVVEESITSAEVSQVESTPSDPVPDMTVVSEETSPVDTAEYLHQDIPTSLQHAPALKVLAATAIPIYVSPTLKKDSSDTAATGSETSEITAEKVESLVESVSVQTTNETSNANPMKKAETVSSSVPDVEETVSDEPERVSPVEEYLLQDVPAAVSHASGMLVLSQVPVTMDGQAAEPEVQPHAPSKDGKKKPLSNVAEVVPEKPSDKEPSADDIPDVVFYTQATSVLSTVPVYSSSGSKMSAPPPVVTAVEQKQSVSKDAAQDVSVEEEPLLTTAEFAMIEGVPACIQYSAALQILESGGLSKLNQPKDKSTPASKGSSVRSPSTDRVEEVLTGSSSSTITVKQATLDKQTSQPGESPAEDQSSDRKFERQPSTERVLETVKASPAVTIQVSEAQISNDEVTQSPVATEVQQKQVEFVPELESLDDFIPDMTDDDVLSETDAAPEDQTQKEQTQDSQKIETEKSKERSEPAVQFLPELDSLDDFMPEMTDDDAFDEQHTLTVDEPIKETVQESVASVPVQVDESSKVEQLEKSQVQLLPDLDSLEDFMPEMTDDDAVEATNEKPDQDTKTQVSSIEEKTQSQFLPDMDSLDDLMPEMTDDDVIDEQAGPVSEKPIAETKEDIVQEAPQITEIENRSDPKGQEAQFLPELDSLDDFMPEMTDDDVVDEEAALVAEATAEAKSNVVLQEAPTLTAANETISEEKTQVQFLPELDSLDDFMPEMTDDDFVDEQQEQEPEKTIPENVPLSQSNGTKSEVKQKKQQVQFLPDLDSLDDFMPEMTDDDFVDEQVQEAPVAESPKAPEVETSVVVKEQPSSQAQFLPDFDSLDDFMPEMTDDDVTEEQSGPVGEEKIIDTKQQSVEQTQKPMTAENESKEQTQAQFLPDLGSLDDFMPEMTDDDAFEEQESTVPVTESSGEQDGSTPEPEARSGFIVDTPENPWRCVYPLDDLAVRPLPEFDISTLQIKPSEPAVDTEKDNMVPEKTEEKAPETKQSAQPTNSESSQELLPDAKIETTVTFLPDLDSLDDFMPEMTDDDVTDTVEPSKEESIPVEQVSQDTKLELENLDDFMPEMTGDDVEPVDTSKTEASDTSASQHTEIQFLPELEGLDDFIPAMTDGNVEEQEPVNIPAPTAETAATDTKQQETQFLPELNSLDDFIPDMTDDDFMVEDDIKPASSLTQQSEKPAKEKPSTPFVPDLGSLDDFLPDMTDDDVVIDDNQAVKEAVKASESTEAEMPSSSTPEGEESSRFTMDEDTDDRPLSQCEQLESDSAFKMSAPMVLSWADDVSDSFDTPVQPAEPELSSSQSDKPHDSTPSVSEEDTPKKKKRNRKNKSKRLPEPELSVAEPTPVVAEPTESTTTSQVVGSDSTGDINKKEKIHVQPAGEVAVKLEEESKRPDSLSLADNTRTETVDIEQDETDNSASATPVSRNITYAQVVAKDQPDLPIVASAEVQPELERIEIEVQKPWQCIYPIEEPDENKPHVPVGATPAKKKKKRRKRKSHSEDEAVGTPTEEIINPDVDMPTSVMETESTAIEEEVAKPSSTEHSVVEESNTIEASSPVESKEIIKSQIDISDEALRSSDNMSSVTEIPESTEDGLKQIPTETPYEQLSEDKYHGVERSPEEEEYLFDLGEDSENERLDKDDSDSCSDDDVKISEDRNSAERGTQTGDGLGRLRRRRRKRMKKRAALLAMKIAARERGEKIELPVHGSHRRKKRTKNEADTSTETPSNCSPSSVTSSGVQKVDKSTITPDREILCNSAKASTTKEAPVKRFSNAADDKRAVLEKQSSESTVSESMSSSLTSVPDSSSATTKKESDAETFTEGKAKKRKNKKERKQVQQAPVESHRLPLAKSSQSQLSTESSFKETDSEHGEAKAGLESDSKETLQDVIHRLEKGNSPTKTGNEHGKGKKRNKKKKAAPCEETRTDGAASQDNQRFLDLGDDPQPPKHKSYGEPESLESVELSNTGQQQQININTNQSFLELGHESKPPDKDTDVQNEDAQTMKLSETKQLVEAEVEIKSETIEPEKELEVKEKARITKVENLDGEVVTDILEPSGKQKRRREKKKRQREIEKMNRQNKSSSETVEISSLDTQEELAQAVPEGESTKNDVLEEQVIPIVAAGETKPEVLDTQEVPIIGEDKPVAPDIEGKDIEPEEPVSTELTSKQKRRRLRKQRKREEERAARKKSKELVSPVESDTCEEEPKTDDSILLDSDNDAVKAEKPQTNINMQETIVVDATQESAVSPHQDSVDGQGSKPGEALHESCPNETTSLAVREAESTDDVVDIIDPESMSDLDTGFPTSSEIERAEPKEELDISETTQPAVEYEEDVTPILTTVTDKAASDLELEAHVEQPAAASDDMDTGLQNTEQDTCELTTSVATPKDATPVLVDISTTGAKPKDKEQKVEVQDLSIIVTTQPEVPETKEEQHIKPVQLERKGENDTAEHKDVDEQDIPVDLEGGEPLSKENNSLQLSNPITGEPDVPISAPNDMDPKITKDQAFKLCTPESEERIRKENVPLEIQTAESSVVKLDEQDVNEEKEKPRKEKKKIDDLPSESELPYPCTLADVSVPKRKKKKKKSMQQKFAEELDRLNTDYALQTDLVPEEETESNKDIGRGLDKDEQLRKEPIVVEDEKAQMDIAKKHTEKAIKDSDQSRKECSCETSSIQMSAEPVPSTEEDEPLIEKPQTLVTRSPSMDWNDVVRHYHMDMPTILYHILGIRTLVSVETGCVPLPPIPEEPEEVPVRETTIAPESQVESVTYHKPAGTVPEAAEVKVERTRISPVVPPDEISLIPYYWQGLHTLSSIESGDLAFPVQGTSFSQEVATPEKIETVVGDQSIVQPTEPPQPIAVAVAESVLSDLDDEESPLPACRPSEPIAMSPTTAEEVSVTLLSPSTQPRNNNSVLPEEPVWPDQVIPVKQETHSSPMTSPDLDDEVFIEDVQAVMAPPPRPPPPRRKPAKQKAIPTIAITPSDPLPADHFDRFPYSQLISEMKIIDLEYVVETENIEIVECYKDEVEQGDMGGGFVPDVTEPGQQIKDNSRPDEGTNVSNKAEQPGKPEVSAQELPYVLQPELSKAAKEEIAEELRACEPSQIMTRSQDLTTTESSDIEVLSEADSLEDLPSDSESLDLTHIGASNGGTVWISPRDKGSPVFAISTGSNIPQEIESPQSSGFQEGSFPADSTPPVMVTSNMSVDSLTAEPDSLVQSAHSDFETIELTDAELATAASTCLPSINEVNNFQQSGSMTSITDPEPATHQGNQINPAFGDHNHPTNRRPGSPEVPDGSKPADDTDPSSLPLPADEDVVDSFDASDEEVMGLMEDGVKVVPDPWAIEMEEEQKKRMMEKMCGSPNKEMNQTVEPSIPASDSAPVPQLRKRKVSNDQLKRKRKVDDNQISDDSLDETQQAAGGQDSVGDIKPRPIAVSRRRRKFNDRSFSEDSLDDGSKEVEGIMQGFSSINDEQPLSKEETQDTEENMELIPAVSRSPFQQSGIEFLVASHQPQAEEDGPAIEPKAQRQPSSEDDLPPPIRIAKRSEAENAAAAMPMVVITTDVSPLPPEVVEMVIAGVRPPRDLIEPHLQKFEAEERKKQLEMFEKAFAKPQAPPPKEESSAFSVIKPDSAKRLHGKSTKVKQVQEGPVQAAEAVPDDHSKLKESSEEPQEPLCPVAVKPNMSGGSKAKTELLSARSEPDDQVVPSNEDENLHNLDMTDCALPRIHTDEVLAVHKVNLEEYNEYIFEKGDPQAEAKVEETPDVTDAASSPITEPVTEPVTEPEEIEENEWMEEIREATIACKEKVAYKAPKQSKTPEFDPKVYNAWAFSIEDGSRADWPGNFPNIEVAQDENLNAEIASDRPDEDYTRMVSPDLDPSRNENLMEIYFGHDEEMHEHEPHHEAKTVHTAEMIDPGDSVQTNEPDIRYAPPMEEPPEPPDETPFDVDKGLLEKRSHLKREPSKDSIDSVELASARDQIFQMATGMQPKTYSKEKEAHFLSDDSLDRDDKSETTEAAESPKPRVEGRSEKRRNKRKKAKETAKTLQVDNDSSKSTDENMDVNKVPVGATAKTDQPTGVKKKGPPVPPKPKTKSKKTKGLLKLPGKKSKSGGKKKVTFEDGESATSSDDSDTYVVDEKGADDDSDLEEFAEYELISDKFDESSTKL